MKRLMIYIAGPISKGDLAHNINQATDAFKELALLGFAPLCPQWSCFSTGALRAATSGAVYAMGTVGGCGLAHQHWIDIDLEFVGRSDAVLRLPGESTGADIEVRHATAKGIPVFTSIKELVAWKNERCADRGV